MEPKTKWPWIWLLLMVSAAEGRQTPDERALDLMSPQDRKDVLRDQVYLPRPNIANKEHVGLHEAAKKRLLEAFEEASAGIQIDADPELQSLKHVKTKEEERKRQEQLKRERKPKKNRKNYKGLRDRLMKKMKKTMKKMEADPKFAKFLKQKEQGKNQLGLFGKAKKRSGKRSKRSAEASVPQDLNFKSSVNAHEQAHKREKRFATMSSNSLWPSGVVPYFFDAGYPDDYKKEVLMAMQLYSDLTTVTFTQNDSQLATSLSHSSKLHFISDQPRMCWSHIGFNNLFDQFISCFQCGIVACIHEVGHAIGLEHEQQHSWRDRLEKIHWDNVPSDQSIFNNYLKKPLTDKYGNVIRSTFDRGVNPASYMHYSSNMQDPSWTVNYQPQINFYDSDVEEISKWGSNEVSAHYHVKDINAYYKPQVDPCGSSGLTCVNDGYVTKFRKLECKCICVQGLSSDSNCAALEQDDPDLKNSSWPIGTALLRPRDGCPAGFHGDASVMFKSGTYQTPINWIGQMASSVNGSLWELQLDFCVHDGTSQPNELPSEPGDYCYIKTVGGCGEGYTEGTVQFHDISDSAQSSGTNFPSGTFSGATVIIDFCCRSDGYVDIPIRLPTSHPFALFPHYLKGCQAVEGMQADMTSITFNNTVDGYEAYGDHPHIYKFHNKPMFNLYVCYYTPVSYDGCGGIYSVDANNPEQIIQTPDYPSNYPPNKRCTWIFHSPEDTKMVLNFNNFNIPAGPDGNAEDYVEIRNILPGIIGNLYYGDSMHRSWVTYSNYLAVYLFSNGDEMATGFNGTVRMVTQSDLVYSGKGENYDGPRNYTRTFQNCISWAEAKENKCTEDPYSEIDRFDILEGNYCRNPCGIVDFPFCFTHAKNNYCRAELCDVSNLELCHNSWTDCTQDVCATKDAAKCAQTCGICEAREAEVQSFPQGCGPPSQTFGPYQPVKSSYSMGESVTFTCNGTEEEVTQTCSTMGNWLPRLQHLCGSGIGCKSDEFEYNTEDGLTCLKVLPDSFYTYEDARSSCSAEGGHLVMEKDTVSSQLLESLSFTFSFWLGLSDTVNEGTFQWVDGLPLTYEEKWAQAEPDSYKPKWSGNGTHYASVTWNKGSDGSTCIPWSSVVGISQWAYDQYFPVDGSVANAGDNCRDPSNDRHLWCYISTNLDWRWCDITQQVFPGLCNGEIESETLYYGTRVNHYHGSQTSSSYGLDCWTWALGYPDSYFEDNYETAADAGNKCRLIGYSHPWCWVYNNGWFMDNCTVPEYCGEHGYRKTNEYMGTVDVTTYGYTCLRWDYLATLVGFEWLTDYFHYYFLDDNITVVENYCRSGPWGIYTKPACYFVYPVDGLIYSGYCAVPEEEEMQDCVIRDGTTGLWHDVYCDEPYMAVCEIPAESARTECSDQNANCMARFEENPAVFVDNPDWAETRCALTSGACTPSDPTQPNPVTCNGPYTDPAGMNLDVVRLAPTVTVGDYIEHQCKPLYKLVSGNLKQGCTVSGTWTGSTPNCTLRSLVGGWNNDVDIRDRHSLGARNTVYLADNKFNRIELIGEVTGWRFYSYSPGQFEFFVFRQNGQINSFTVVNKTVVAAFPDTRAKTIDLPAEERFPVFGGDIFGWRFNSVSDGGIPCDKCKLEHTEGGNWYELSGGGQLEVGSTYDFMAAWDDCRICSISVNVSPTP